MWSLSRCCCCFRHSPPAPANTSLRAKKARPLPSTETWISTHHLHGDIAGNKAGHVGATPARPHATEIGVHEIVLLHTHAPARQDFGLGWSGGLHVVQIRS